MKKLYTCKQVADIYNVQIATVWRWIRERKLESWKIGRLYRVHEDDLKRFDKQNAQKQAE